MTRSFARRLFVPRSGIGAEGGKDGYFGGGIWTAIATVGAIAGAYHGFKRNHGDVGWSLAWGLGGAVFPIPTVVPIALLQGFGKPA